MRGSRSDASGPQLRRCANRLPDEAAGSLLNFLDVRASNGSRVRLKRRDGEEIIEAGEIFGVAGVDRSAVRMRGGGDEQIHDPRSRLPPHRSDTSGKPAVAFRDSVIDRQCVEPPLNGTQARKPNRSRLLVPCDQHAKVKLGNAGDADRQFPGDGDNVVSD